MKKYAVGLSTPDFVNEELFAEMAEAGIKYTEISVDKWQSEKLDFGKLKEWSEKYRVCLWSFHLPFYPFDEIDISKKDIADKSVAYLSEYIRKASEIGIDKFIIHASGEPIQDGERKTRMECAKNSLNELCKVAEKYGSVICVEDLPRTCLGRDSREIKELLSANDNLRVCFDTNHLLGEEIKDFIDTLGDKIVTTHISDYDFKNERHWLPGEGEIDWQSLISALDKVGYDGVWLYEISLACPWTYIRDRRLTCKDFVKNAEELFEGKTPAPLGKPLEGLKHWTEG